MSHAPGRPAGLVQGAAVSLSVVDAPADIPIYLIHWNAVERLVRSVTSLLGSREVGLNITVIDSGSEPAAIEQLRTELPATVRLVPAGSNVGFAGGANIAVLDHLSRGRGDLLIIGAHDILVDPACLSELTAAAVGHPDFGVLGPAHHGRSLADAPHWYGGSFSWWRGANFSPRSQGHSDPGSVIEVDWVPGMLMAIRSSCVAQTGGLDERLFAYWEDVEFCLRAARAGWRVGVVPAAVAAEQGYSSSYYNQAYLVARNHLLVVGRLMGRVAQSVVALRLALWSLSALVGSILPTRDGEHRARSRSYATGRWAGVRAGLRGVSGPPPVFRAGAQLEQPSSPLPS